MNSSISFSKNEHSVKLTVPLFNDQFFNLNNFIYSIFLSPQELDAGADSGEFAGCAHAVQEQHSAVQGSHVSGLVLL